MSGSGTKRWIIGLVVLTAVVLAAAAYLMSKKPAERADKGTLVHEAADRLRAAGEMAGDGLQSVGEMAGDSLRAVGEMAGDSLRAAGRMAGNGMQSAGVMVRGAVRPAGGRL